MSSIIAIRQNEFCDPEALQDAVQDGQSDIAQLEPGQITVKLTHLTLGSVGASTGDFTRGIRQRGVLSPNRWVFGFIANPAVICYHDMAPDDLLILAPGQELYSSFSGANNYVTVLAEQEEMFARLTHEPGAQDAPAWGQPSTMLTTDPALAAARTAEVRKLLGVIAKQGTTMPPWEAEHYKHAILELVTAPVIDAAGYRYRGPRLRSEVALVREVENFVIEAGTRPLLISDLVVHAGVSRRALYRAFDEVHSMSPMEFLRRKQLSDAHNALLTATPGTTVEKAAIKHGFAHPGRFAKWYYSQFGERPNETLRRPSPFRRLQ
ncbi:hypothetical protein BSZ19_21825 [Bradyrhizobium japonicum]|uniref:HTH araC/xylS-type domain-containing protein n=1 Tax=Bradyrhizobium japonicum TaxID=375 RepID=A0A1Y2JLU2_BRAJP|nr:helix-turn-helix domain-containing protein [Bradyrhizobium japonicum]OSJ31526.1 hypothetical protein BSZ19_21825 [Bradyrhizobium japonicum]